MWKLRGVVLYPYLQPQDKFPVPKVHFIFLHLKYVLCKLLLENSGLEPNHVRRSIHIKEKLMIFTPLIVNYETTLKRFQSDDVFFCLLPIPPLFRNQKAFQKPSRELASTSIKDQPHQKWNFPARFSQIPEGLYSWLTIPSSRVSNHVRTF